MNDLTTIRIPPHSDEAETAFLCAVLERNSLVDDVESILTPESFYRHENQMIFRRMRTMALICQPIDLVTLANAMDAAGEYDDNMAQYLYDLAGMSRGAANAIHYARMIQDKHTDRVLIAKGHEITDIAYSDGTTAEKLDRAQSVIMDATETSAGDAVDATSALRDLIPHLQFLESNKGNLVGLGTGWQDLDRLTNGLQNSDMIVIAGRPAMGKSTAAMNIAEHVSVVQKKVVLVFSLEMPVRQLMLRSMCSIGRIKLDLVKRGQLNDEWGLVTSAAARIKDAPLYIDDRSSLTSEQMLSRARKLQKRIGRKIDLIIVDYLQLMTDKGEGVERVTKISRNIKLCAKEMDCPVIAISQLSRKVEERGEKRPVNSDLRDSGAIEQDADIISFIFRDEVYTKEKSNRKGIAELLITKHRNGELGTVYLTSRLDMCRFDSNVGYIPPQDFTPTKRRGFAE
jgi:replicative DNA helicase